MAISRQELKSDQFVSTLDNWYEFYLNYQKQILIGAIAVAVAIAVVVGVLDWARTRNARAEALLSSGLETLHAPLANAAEPAPAGVQTYNDAQERARAAQASFRAAADTYAGTESGREARYYLGLTEIDLGKTAAAEADLTAAAAGKDARVASLAQNALANLYASEGKSAQAQALFEKLIAHPSNIVPRPLAMMELAELQSVTNPAAAGKLYQQIQREYPNSELAQTAQQNLASLPPQ